MRQSTLTPQIYDFMNRHLPDVFDTMLAMKAVAMPANTLPLFDERVTGNVAFAGEHINGGVYLHLGAPFALQVAASMLGLAPNELGEAEVNDVVGEVTNMLTGGLKSWLCDVGAQCAVSTPAIIRGSAFSIQPTPNVERKWLLFQCNDDHIVVQIHVKIA